MADTYVLPTHPIRPSKARFIPPLLVFPFLVYNIVVFILFGANPANWNFLMVGIPMPSGMTWGITAGDFLAVVGILLLFIEVLKSTRIARASIVDHMLSMGLFILFLIEFLLVGAAASSVFFLLMVMSLIDVVAGFTVSITSASRDVHAG
jgi:hypothetical protein